jgi:predicted translin family RNA/ssDNA-binding protein
MIKIQYGSISKDLQGLNAFRYRSITGGNQEFIEAITFQHYLETQRLLSYEGAVSELVRLGGSQGPVLLTPDDYILGVFDMVGELMRFAVTTMATTGGLPGYTVPSVHGSSRDDAPEHDRGTRDHLEHIDRSILEDLRELRAYLEGFTTEDSFLSRDLGKKITVMQQCVEKVENAVYSLIVRGSERPKGWMPDAGASTVPIGEAVEGY